MLREQSAIFFKLLLNRFSKLSDEELRSLLPQEESEALSHIACSAKDPTLILHTNSAFFTPIHYSWIGDSIKKLPEPLRAPVAATLPLNVQEGLKRLGVIQDIKKAHFSKAVLHFLQSLLFQAWIEDKPSNRQAKPIEFLSESALLPLLSLSKHDIIKIIDLLSMHDLANEVRHIVDKTHLQAILCLLSQEQRNYLRECLHQVSKIPALPLNAKVVYKDKKTFIKTLHRHGMERFALALSGAPRDLLWHFLHILDSGRAKIFEALIKNEEVPKSTAIVRLEVLQIMQRIQAKEAL
jgi:hypothetical protein